MKRILRTKSFLWGGALAAMATQPGLAASATITDVEVNPTASGVEIVLGTQGGEAGNVFTMKQGNSLRADITGTQLNLPNGGEFRQANPAPGIAAISVVPLDANSVRLTIEGTDQVPAGSVQNTSDGSMVFAVQTDAAAAQAETVIPNEIQTVPGSSASQQVAQASPAPTDAAPAQPAASPAPATPQTEDAPDVMVPNPEVTIDGVPVPQPQVLQAPPFLPRAVAPPVGDIAVAESPVIAESIDLGSNERIPKLVLRNAPAREVLSLLARAAGLNLVFTGDGAGGDAAAASGADGPVVTLDIENESVQDVFNHVLRVSGLQANRVGRSIYVGPQLPDGARSLVSRTLRLNQVSAIQAAGFLASLGAAATQTVTRDEIETVTVESPIENAPPVTRTREFTSTSVEDITYDPGAESRVARPLQGLQAVADPRLNSITVVGEPTLVSLATQYLTRIDLRQRQVAVNVKIVDVNLTATEAFGFSFSFGLGSTGLINTGGAGVINFGGSSPAGVSSPLNPAGIAGVNPGSTIFPVPGNFFAQLQAQVTNGNAKILTDPTLVVQEGQTANVNLTQEVVTNVTTNISTSTPPVITTTIEKEQAGLQLGLQIQRIDDNGFVTLNVAPRVTSIGATQQVNTGSANNTIALLNIREVSSGSVRLRDGQSLILAGVIQDQDRVEVSKVPILGDIPILGALFRSTSETSQRNEVIVVLTPQILDDSDQSVYGYSYTPSEEVREILEQNR